MSVTIKFVTVPSKTLVTSINSSAYSIQISDILGWDGNALTSANFGDVLWAILRNSTNTQMEIMQLDPTTIANSSITVLARGLDFSGGLVEVPANKLTWIKNDTIIELGTNPPQLLTQGVMVSGNQTIADLKIFTTLPQSSVVPVNSTDLVNKAYADAGFTGNVHYDQNIIAGVAGAILIQGQVTYLKASDGKWYVADSSATATSVGVQLGIAQAAATLGGAVNILIGGRDKTQTGLTAGLSYYLSTAGAISTTKGTNIRLVGQVPSGSTTDLVTNFAAGDPNIATTDSSKVYAADSGSSNAFVITLTPAISGYKTGQVFFFKAGFTNTGAATLAVNGLSAIAIKKAVSTALVSGDIASGQLVEVQYDGTNFQLLSQSSILPQSAKAGGTGSDGALSITSGTTTISASSAAYVEKNYTSVSITGTGNLAFSTPATAGTTVAIFIQGGATITTSSTHAIDVRAMGGTTSSGYILADVQQNGAGTNGGGGTGGGSTGGPGAGTILANGTSTYYSIIGGAGIPPLSPLTRYAPPGGNGSAGTTGGNNGFSLGSGAAGGLGGGGLYIECAGAWNFTTGALDASGATGGASAHNTSGGNQGGCGGGGGGGNILLLYGTLTADSGSYTVSGGAGGTNAFGASGGSAGSNGTAYRALITHFS